MITGGSWTVPGAAHTSATPGLWSRDVTGQWTFSRLGFFVVLKRVVDSLLFVCVLFQVTV